MIEYAYILLNIGSDNVIIYEGCYEMYLVAFTVSYWIDMDYKTCWTVVGSFLKICRIQTLVIFLDWST